MNIDFGFATRDDCLERMVPSDLRQLVCERDTAELKAKQLGAKVEGFGDTIEVLQAERDSWRRVAERIETEKQQLEARVAELEAALTEASNNGAEGDDGYSNVACFTEDQLNMAKNKVCELIMSDDFKIQNINHSHPRLRGHMAYESEVAEWMALNT